MTLPLSRDTRLHTRWLLLCALTSSLLIGAFAPVSRADDSSSAAEARLFELARYLASDKLRGRSAGDRGGRMAAEYIADRFVDIGLDTDIEDGKPFQKFTFGQNAKLGPEKKNRLLLAGPPKENAGLPQRIELTLGEDFTPMLIGGSRTFNLPLVFAGYGISAEKEKYDDYRDLDVNGKAVLILAKEPQQDDPESVFNGRQASSYASYEKKVANAQSHGAAAVIIVSDQFDMHRRRDSERRDWQKAVDKLAEVNAKFKELGEPTQEQIDEHFDEVGKLTEEIKSRAEKLDLGMDTLVSLSAAGREGKSELPVMFAKRAAVDPIVQAALGKSLAELEAAIEEGPAPASAELSRWKAIGETRLIRGPIKARNVAAVLRGEGPLAEESIVIGGHYDHVGFRPVDARKPSPEKIYNGADDNASGIAVIMEVARRLAAREKKLPRSVVFVAFDAEERGLHGSKHYVANPILPLDKTLAMLNLDMVGRLREKMHITGLGKIDELDPWLEEANRSPGFDLDRRVRNFGGSDHMPFRKSEVPAVQFVTGLHEDYHRTTDDVEKLNIEGMRRLAELLTDMTVRLAETEQRPVFISPEEAKAAKEKKPLFGASAQPSPDAGGFLVRSVIEGSVAQKGGVQNGDVVIRLGNDAVGGLKDFLTAFGKHKPGDKVECVVRRGDTEVKLTLTIEGPGE